MLALNDRFKSMDHHVQVVTSLKTFLTKIKIGIHLSFQVLASGLDKLKLSVYVLTRFPRVNQDGGATDLERDGSDGHNEEAVYDEVPLGDESSDMSEVAVNRSNSTQNDNYESVE